MTFPMSMIYVFGEMIAYFNISNYLRYAPNISARLFSLQSFLLIEKLNTYEIITIKRKEKKLSESCREIFAKIVVFETTFRQPSSNGKKLIHILIVIYNYQKSNLLITFQQIFPFLTDCFDN